MSIRRKMLENAWKVRESDNYWSWQILGAMLISVCPIFTVIITINLHLSLICFTIVRNVYSTFNVQHSSVIDVTVTNSERNHPNMVMKWISAVGGGTVSRNLRIWKCLPSQSQSAFFLKSEFLLNSLGSILHFMKDIWISMEGNSCVVEWACWKCSGIK